MARTLLRRGEGRASLSKLMKRGTFDDDDEADDEEEGEISLEGVHVKMRTPASKVKKMSGVTEDTPMGEGGDNSSPANPVLTPEESARKEALTKFAKTLHLFHQRMQQGFSVLLWDGQDMTNKIEARMSLSSSNKVISFHDPKSARRQSFSTMFAAMMGPKSVAPIRIVDIFETLPGGDINALAENGEVVDAAYENSLLTLVTKSEGNRPRTILMKLANKEERNNIISGFRMMHSAQTSMAKDLAGLDGNASLQGSRAHLWSKTRCGRTSKQCKYSITAYKQKWCRHCW